MKQQYICQKSYTYARNHISGIVSGICTRSTLFKQRSLPSVSSALDAHLIHTFDCYRSATDLHLQTSDPAIHGAMQIDCQQMARRLVLQILIGFTPSPDLDAKRKDVLEGEEIGTVANYVKRAKVTVMRRRPITLSGVVASWNAYATRLNVWQVVDYCFRPCGCVATKASSFQMTACVQNHRCTHSDTGTHTCWQRLCAFDLWPRLCTFLTAQFWPRAGPAIPTRAAVGSSQHLIWYTAGTKALTDVTKRTMPAATDTRIL